MDKNSKIAIGASIAGGLLLLVVFGSRRKSGGGAHILPVEPAVNHAVQQAAAFVPVQQAVKPTSPLDGMSLDALRRRYGTAVERAVNAAIDGASPSVSDAELDRLVHAASISGLRSALDEDHVTARQLVDALAHLGATSDTLYMLASQIAAPSLRA